MKILVLGAGVLGTTTAWYLRKSGHEIVVLDRQPVAGLETSFANGGHVSVSHAGPWASPGVPMKLLKWLGKEDAPFLFRLRADAAQWAWTLRFLRECLPGRTRANTLRLLKLASYSLQHLKTLRAKTDIDYDATTQGILHLYGNHGDLVRAADRARALADMGDRIAVLDPQGCVRLEPALARCTLPLVGATYASEDECGDAHMFTRALERRLIEGGAAFRFGVTICGLEVQAGRLTGVNIQSMTGESETLAADAYVCCLGTGSAALLGALGIHIPVYPVKGYSLTIAIDDPARAPRLGVTHEDSKLFCSRLGMRLRVAGTAELAGYDKAIRVPRIDMLRKKTQALFPGVGDFNNAMPWAGLRPATPDNVPLIGAAPLKNLYLNTGHGTLGWTLACGSGQAIADLIGGRRPEVDFPFL